MPVLKLFPTLSLLVALSIFSSCSKEAQTEPTHAKTDLLVAREWKGDQALVSGLDVKLIRQLPTGQPLEVLATIPDTENLRLTFYKDGTYKSTMVEDGLTETAEGTWAFNDKQTSIKLDLGGELEVKTLSPPILTSQRLSPSVASSIE